MFCCQFITFALRQYVLMIDHDFQIDCKLRNIPYLLLLNVHSGAQKLFLSLLSGKIKQKTLQCVIYIVPTGLHNGGGCFIIYPYLAPNGAVP